MKGITHFVSGVAVASCFPFAVESIFSDKSLLLPMGGLFAILPDTMDFRFARYIWHYKNTVQIDENKLDPKVVAEAVASSIDEAQKTGKMITLRLNIIRISCSYYRTYNVYIDEEKKKVIAVIGPLKTMSNVMETHEHMPPPEVFKKWIDEEGVAVAFKRLYEKLPCLPESAPKENNFHVAKFEADIESTYYRLSEVGIFSGPDFSFQPVNGKIRIDFIPWHRRWSHSLTFGVLMGFIAFALLASWGELFAGNIAGFANSYATTGFFIAMLGFWAHIIEDQTGHLGSNLLYPLTKHRSLGMKLTTAASPASNIMTNWLALAIIVWNLNAHAPSPVLIMPWAANMEGGFSDWSYYLVSLLNYVVFAVVIPFGIYWFYRYQTGDESEEISDAAFYAGDQGDA